jgi:hypothetical protein
MAIPACFLPNEATAALMRQIAEGHPVTMDEARPLIDVGLVRRLTIGADDFGLTIVGARCLKRVDPDFEALYS